MFDIVLNKIFNNSKKLLYKFAIFFYIIVLYTRHKILSFIDNNFKYILRGNKNGKKNENHGW